ncbi:hypothetical protein C8Q78DRAFT_1075622 [Trametes maxima]|nr:hypothetical protein C8Q78DRAFT_1075622 [Trametes maxima]
MQASGSTHRFTRRGSVLDPPVIGGIVAVVVALNIVLALSFWVLRARSKRRTHRKRVPSPGDAEKRYSTIPSRISTGGAPGAVLPSTAEGAERKSYFELIQALQQQPAVPSPTRLSHSSWRNSAESLEGLSHYILRPQDIRELDGVSRYPKGKGRVQALQQSVLVAPSDKSALTRSNSLADTASVYSSASAPMEYHEHLFRTQPFALPPSPPASAPAWMVELPKPLAPAVIPGIRPTIDDDSERRLPVALQSAAPTVHNTRRRPSRPDVPSTPTVSPTSTQSPLSPSRLRARSVSSPQSPPQILWLSTKEADLFVPGSAESTSTISSLREATRVPVVPPTIVAPLNVRRRSTAMIGGRSSREQPPLFVAEQSTVRPPPGFLPYAEPQYTLGFSTQGAMSAAGTAGPMIPARSPRRPAPSGSAGH